MKNSMEKKSTGASLLRRYKWEDLTEAEKEAVSDAVGIAATRAGVGIGIVLTGAALISSARRGKPPLPPFIRYGGVTFFSLVGAYIGFISAGSTYAKRILSVPESKLAEDLRIAVGDWQARVPSNPMNLEESTAQSMNEEPSLGPAPPAQDFSASPNNSNVRAKSDREGNEECDVTRKKGGDTRGLTYWLGLTKS